MSLLARAACANGAGYELDLGEQEASAAIAVCGAAHSGNARGSTEEIGVVVPGYEVGVEDAASGPELTAQIFHREGAAANICEVHERDTVDPPDHAGGGALGVKQQVDRGIGPAHAELGASRTAARR